LSVSHRDGQAGTLHPLEEDRRGGLDPHQRQARLELLRSIANERGPALRAWDQLLQPREHLAAVAHAEREALRVAEEALERLARPGVKEDRLGPAEPGAQHVPVRE